MQQEIVHLSPHAFKGLDIGERFMKPVERYQLDKAY